MTGAAAGQEAKTDDAIDQFVLKGMRQAARRSAFCVEALIG